MIKLSIKNLKFRFRLVAQISFICLLSSMATQVSAQAGWTQIGATKLSTYDAKDGSLRNGKTKGGDAFVSIIVRRTSKDDDRIDVSERYVKTKERLHKSPDRAPRTLNTDEPDQPCPERIRVGSQAHAQAGVPGRDGSGHPMV